jgi:basic membrane protein A
MSLSLILAACALMSGPGPSELTPSPAAPTLVATGPAVQPDTPTPAPTASPTPIPFTIAFVARVGSARPGSIAALSLQGAQVAASAQSAQLDVIDLDAISSNDPDLALRQAAGDGPGLLIVAGAELADAARSVAADFPDLPVIGVDQPAAGLPANYFVVGGPDNRIDQEGFLGGMLAGLLTEARKVGIVVVAGTLDGRLYATGFLHGVRFTCGDCEVRTVELDSPSNLSEGEGTASRLKNAGVDVMFAAAGEAGDSGLGAASALGVGSIGTGYDHVAASGGDPLVLGSVLRRPDLTLPGVVAALIAGKRPPPSPFSLANGSLSLSENLGPAVSPAIVNVIGDTLPDLASGLLDTGVDLSTGGEQ